MLSCLYGCRGVYQLAVVTHVTHRPATVAVRMTLPSRRWMPCRVMLLCDTLMEMNSTPVVRKSSFATARKPLLRPKPRAAPRRRATASTVNGLVRRMHIVVCCDLSIGKMYLWDAKVLRRCALRARSTSSASFGVDYRPGTGQQVMPDI